MNSRRTPRPPSAHGSSTRPRHPSNVLVRRRRLPRTDEREPGLVVDRSRSARFARTWARNGGGGEGCEEWFEDCGPCREEAVVVEVEDAAVGSPLDEAEVDERRQEQEPERVSV